MISLIPDGTKGVDNLAAYAPPRRVASPSPDLSVGNPLPAQEFGFGKLVFGTFPHLQGVTNFHYETFGGVFEFMLQASEVCRPYA